jgi:hypothetical protein
MSFSLRVLRVPQTNIGRELTRADSIKRRVCAIIELRLRGFASAPPSYSVTHVIFLDACWHDAGGKAGAFVASHHVIDAFLLVCGSYH